MQPTLFPFSKVKITLAHSLLIFLVAAGVRIGFVVLKGPVVGGDTPDYILLAHNIIDHQVFSLNQSEPYEISIRRAPAYPAFLALTYPLHRWNFFSIAMIQALLGAITALAGMWIARYLLPFPYAFATGLFISLHPGLIANCPSILSEPLFTFLLVLSTALIIMSKIHRRLILAVLGAITLGIAALCRPIASPLALFFAAGLYYKDRRDWRTPGLILLVFGFTISPWVLRCSLPAGGLVMIQGHGKLNFYLSTVKYDGSEEAELWRTFNKDPYSIRLRDARTLPDLLAADDWAFQEAVKRIKASPVEYLKKRARNYPHLFLNSMDSITGFNQSFKELILQHNYLRMVIKLILLFFFSALPFFMGLIGLIGSRNHIISFLSACVWCYMLAIHLPLWIEYRFWIPVLPFLIISSMLGISLIVKFAHTWKKSKMY